MAIDAGIGSYQQVTVKMVNKWCILPKFMHTLISHKTNKSLVDVSKYPETLRIVLYAMRHHVHDHASSNVQGHPCLIQVYNFSTTPTNLVAGEFNSILDALSLWR